MGEGRKKSRRFSLFHSPHLGRLVRTLLVGPDSLFSGAPASGSFFQPRFQFSSSLREARCTPAIPQSIVFSVFVSPTIVSCFIRQSAHCIHGQGHTHTWNVGSTGEQPCALLPLYSSRNLTSACPGQVIQSPCVSKTETQDDRKQVA